MNWFLRYERAMAAACMSALCALSVLAAPAPEKRVVARMYFDNRAVLDQWASHLDIWEVHHDQGWALAMLRESQYQDFSAQGLRIEQDALRTRQVNELRPLAIPGNGCYRTVEETYADMARLASNYPGLADWMDIGDSWEKISSGGSAGYDLYALRLSNKALPGPKPAFFLIAAIHAREWTTAETAARLAEYLAASYGFDADVTWLLDFHDVIIMPQANPDGRKFAEQGYYWRKNTDHDDGCSSFPDYGADLNRNSSFKWDPPLGSSTEPCDEVYRGPSACSEPEVQAIQNFAAGLFSDWRGTNDTDAASTNAQGLFITLHSYGEDVLFPWGSSTSPSPNFLGLQTLGRKFGFFNRYNVASSGAGLYLTSGATDDYMYGEKGIASYTFEMGWNFFDNCGTFSNEVYPDNLPALLYACKAARRPYMEPSGPDSIRLAVAPSTVSNGAAVLLSATVDDTRYSSGEASQTVAGAWFSIDEPPWSSSAVLRAMSAADGAFNAAQENVQATFVASNLSGGRHLIYVQGSDAGGARGVPSAVFLDVGGPEAVLQPPAGGTAAIQWRSLTNTLYEVARSTNLLAGFSTLTSRVPANVSGLNVVTDAPAGGAVFYRVGAVQP